MRHQLSTLSLVLFAAFSITACSKSSKPDPTICILPEGMNCLKVKYIGTTGWDLVQLPSAVSPYTMSYELNGQTYPNVVGIDKGLLPSSLAAGQDVWIQVTGADTAFVYQTIWVPVKAVFKISGASATGCPTGPQPGSK